MYACTHVAISFRFVMRLTACRHGKEPGRARYAAHGHGGLSVSCMCCVQGLFTGCRKGPGAEIKRVGEQICGRVRCQLE